MTFSISRRLLSLQFLFCFPSWSATIRSSEAWLQRGGITRNRYSGKAHIKMDLETPYDQDTNVLRRLKIAVTQKGANGHQTHHRLNVPRKDLDESVEQAENSHGMPWTSSIDPTYGEKSLYYMPFWEWQLAFMKKQLTNLRAIPATSKDGKDLSYAENSEKKVRCHTIQFASDEYKCIRMTLYDAGNATQVFTSLWYPNPSYNLPVLGIDLLQFNKKKHLCIMDFQPIQSTEHEHDQAYEHLLKPIRDLYPSLQGSMTKRFYDENQFFSKQMLLGRHEATPENPPHDMVFGDLFPAFQSYLRTHVELIQSTTPNLDRIPAVLKRHAAYDAYSSVRDPAHALLAKSFGTEWADAYVYDVLFPLSRSKRRD